jgi:hypothetical protein
MTPYYVLGGGNLLRARFEVLAAVPMKIGVF